MWRILLLLLLLPTFQVSAFAGPSAVVAVTSASASPPPLLSLSSRARVRAVTARRRRTVSASPLGPLRSSFAADGSEYSASADGGDGPPEDEPEDEWKNADGSGYRDTGDDGEGEAPTVELQPVPISKNGGNRFVALVWDRVLQRDKAKDAWDLHNDRIQLTEDHVMFCRKQNLYNETFNAESMVDILWSLPILASDLKRVIGHAMCLESQELGHVQSVLRQDPIVQMLTTGGGDGGDLTDIPLYRWRHIRDYSLRIDDGRDGYPCLCVALDAPPEEAPIGGGGASGSSSSAFLRTGLQNEYLEALIRSERVIAAGPLHLPTEYKDDPSSAAVGDLILFNAKNRVDAVAFAEDLPTARAGLYGSVRVHFYNTLDVTGKFVSEDPLRDAPCEQMREALQYWGYPVEDEQTPWLNW